MAEPQRAPTPTPGVQEGRFLIVEARFYEGIGAMLHQGAAEALRAGGSSCDTVRVPGALEIPAAIAIGVDAAISDGRPYDGVVALGCVIRGETYHFEIVAGESSRALMDLSVARKLPLGNGILTVDTLAQAEERADPARGDKGGDAARAALTLAALKRNLGSR
jgi:6,7-dimethyl-8-ribityllumazine synthase